MKQEAKSTQEKPEAGRNDRIQTRAYELFMERGQQPGRDVDDWLQAERELSTEGGRRRRA